MDKPPHTPVELPTKASICRQSSELTLPSFSAGEPYNEPIVVHGYFSVMNWEAEIRRAMIDYGGKLGGLMTRQRGCDADPPSSPGCKIQGVLGNLVLRQFCQ